MIDWLPFFAIAAIFIGLPGIILHYVTEWRKLKSLKPDDERMLEDLWRSAKRMERRIEALETLIDGEGANRAKADDTFQRRYDQ
ncbi:MAG: envelope stress response membrane protein PspB [Pseudomonadota bacterium]